MNTFTLLTLIASLLYLQAGVWALFKGGSQKKFKIFALICILLVLYAFGNLLIFATSKIEQVYIFDRIASIGWILFPIVTVWFFIEFTQTKNLVFIRVFRFVQVPLAIYCMANALIELENIKHFYHQDDFWFFTPNRELAVFYLFVLYLVSCVISVLSILIQWNRTTGFNYHRAQAKVFFVTIVTFSLTSLVSGIIFPYYGIRLTPGIASVAPLMMIIGMLYALFLQHGRGFDPELIYRLLLNHIEEFLFLLDRQGKIFAANKFTLRTLGYNNYDLSRSDSSLIFSEYGKIVEILHNMEKQTVSRPVRVDLIARDTKRIPVLLELIKITDDFGCEHGYVITCIDYRQKLKLKEEIIGRVKTQNQLDKNREELEMIVANRTRELHEAGQKLQMELIEKKSAEQKNITDLNEKIELIKEIHHRVKNNIQIVISLINMLGNHPGLNNNASEKLKHIDDKVRYISRIHEYFYASPNLANIVFADFLKKSIGELCSSYGLTQDVVLKLNISNEPLDINKAIPLGIIFTESFQNALIHAFFNSNRENFNNIIRIEFLRNHDDYTLIICDNGKGLPENIEEIKTRKIGLQLVEITAKEYLKGELTYTQAHGTQIKISFNWPNS